MSTVIERMASDLELAGYAERTRAAYLGAAHDFVRFCRRPPTRVRQAQLRAWARSLAEPGLSAQSRRRHAAVKFLFARTLGRPAVVAFLGWPKDAAAGAFDSRGPERSRGAPRAQI